MYVHKLLNWVQITEHQAGRQMHVHLYANIHWCTYVRMVCTIHTHQNESSDRYFYALLMLLLVLLSFVINTIRDNGESAWPTQLYNYWGTFWKCTFICTQYVHSVYLIHTYTYCLQNVDSVYEVSIMYFALCLCMQFGIYISLTHTHTYMQLSDTHTTALNWFRNLIYDAYVCSSLGLLTNPICPNFRLRQHALLEEIHLNLTTQNGQAVRWHP